MSARKSTSRIRCTIDFGRQGRQAGYARAPLSRNTSGWGTVEIPIVVYANGPGPTLLLTGGVHGDEYEGPIALSRLIRTLRVEDMRGRLIIMPAVNVPAFLNDTRLSPVDNRDLNRSFPGDPAGTFSQMLAHFIDSVILPMADVSVDLHTCGHSGDCVLSTNMHYIADAGIRARTMEVAAAFGAPANVVFWGVDEGATLTSSVERLGIVSVGTELGGWGRVSVEGVRIAERGVRNVMRHLGMMDGAPETAQRGGQAATRHYMVPNPACYSFAPRGGVFEPRHAVGESVAAGETAGFVHFIEDIDTPPIEIRYAESGELWVTAGPGRVQRGDCVAVLMHAYDAARAAAL